MVVPPVFHDRSTNRELSQATNGRSRTKSRTGLAAYRTSSISIGHTFHLLQSLVVVISLLGSAPINKYNYM